MKCVFCNREPLTYGGNNISNSSSYYCLGYGHYFAVHLIDNKIYYYDFVNQELDIHINGYLMKNITCGNSIRITTPYMKPKSITIQGVQELQDRFNKIIKFQ